MNSPDEDAGGAPNTGGRSPGAVFDVLSHHRRRYALACLAEHDPSLTLADLAEEVAIREQGAPITEISKEEVLSVYLALYHTHVPKLADAGVVEYDQDRDLVTVSDRDRMERFLELASDWRGQR